jgi:hypothetical protein
MKASIALSDYVHVIIHDDDAMTITGERLHSNRRPPQIYLQPAEVERLRVLLSETKRDEAQP